MPLKLYTTVKVDLLAGDSTRTLIAAPGTGVSLVIFRINYISKTSAAQALNVATGATNFLNFAASIAAHTVIDTGWLDGGIIGVSATALIATPASAGPAGTFFVTYTTA